MSTSGKANLIRPKDARQNDWYPVHEKKLGRISALMWIYVDPWDFLRTYAAAPAFFHFIYFLHHIMVRKYDSLWRRKRETESWIAIKFLL